MSMTIGELAGALSRAQGEFETITAEKTGQLGHRKYKYADFASTVTAVRPILAKHGLAVVQRPLETDGQLVKLETLLTHKSGEWIASTLCIQSVNTTAQGIGSALTYARRYGYSSMLGLVTDDDDDGKDAGKPQGFKKTEPVTHKSTLRVEIPVPACDELDRARIIRAAKDLEWNVSKLQQVIQERSKKPHLAHLTKAEAIGLAEALEKKFLGQQGKRTF